MIQPLGQNILVEKDPQGPLSYGGVLIPECAERTPRFAPTILATVLAVGGKVTDVKAGARVALKAYAGDEWEIDGRRLTLLRFKDIVGLAEETV